MKQKQIFIILGAIGIIFVLFWFAVLTLVIKNLRGSNEKSAESPVANVVMCDEDASGLCIVTFGANNLNRMVINFQLPNADYAPFYVKAMNRGTVSIYTCEVVESTPTSAYCTGVRTPLGETIDLEVYATDGDTLIARGSFLISAIALSTPISLPSETPGGEETPTVTPIASATPSPNGEVTPTPTLSKATNTPGSTSTPNTAYPNP